MQLCSLLFQCSRFCLLVLGSSPSDNLRSASMSVALWSNYLQACPKGELRPKIFELAKHLFVPSRVESNPRKEVHKISGWARNSQMSSFVSRAKYFRLGRFQHIENMKSYENMFTLTKQLWCVIHADCFSNGPLKTHHLIAYFRSLLPMERGKNPSHGIRPLGGTLTLTPSPLRVLMYGILTNVRKEGNQLFCQKWHF